MITYKDMTFCECDCTNTECSRYYDAGVAKDAEDVGLPISIADLSKGCPSYLPPQNKKSK